MWKALHHPISGRGPVPAAVVALWSTRATGITTLLATVILFFWILMSRAN